MEALSEVEKLKATIEEKNREIDRLKKVKHLNLQF